MRGARRFREQKWLLDMVISSVGLDWDQLRMAITTAPVGFEGLGDWAMVAGRAKRYDELSPAFAAGAAGREARAIAAKETGDLVSARESYLIAALYYGMAQWPLDEPSNRNHELDAKKIAFPADRQGSLSRRHQRSRHGYLQGDVGLVLWRQVARTGHGRPRDRRSRPIRGTAERPHNRRG